jgi:membrane associated rhomboid family serine protease
MFILGDDTHSHGRIPWVTGSLILLNVTVFCLQRGLGERFTYGFSLIPAEISKGKDLTRPAQIQVKVPHRLVRTRQGRKIEYRDEWVTVPQYPGPFPIYLTLFTSMFLHTGWMHLIGNMWFLGVFGRNVECALNHGRFLAYYMICGLAGGLCQVASDPHSVIPCLGASGAISGVMGSYLAIYPLNKVKLWLGFLWGVVEVPAIVVLGIWFLWQYLSAFVSLEQPEFGGGVAYWDHLGGFAAGLLLIFGTIAYLKWQAARQPPVEEIADVETPAQPELVEVQDLGDFLPR